MKKFVGACLALTLAVGGMAIGSEKAADPEKKVVSGLELGEFPQAFLVEDITGPERGNTLCYRCRFGARPVVSVFAREMNDEVATLVTKLDKVVGKHEDQKMAAFVVLLTDKPDEAEPALKKVSESKKLKNVPLTISVEGTEGPASYKVSEDADVTVMMWVDSKVKVNHAFAKGKLNEKAVDAIVADTKKILE